MTGSCGAGNHTVSQVGDAEWRCWRCGADQGVMEREEEEAVGFCDSRQDDLTDRHIATPPGVANAQQSRPSLTQDVPPHHPTHGHYRPNPERQDQQ